MRYGLIVAAFGIAALASCAAWERVRDDIADPDGQIRTAAYEGGERFLERPSAETAASWGMEVLIAILSVATGGLGLTQLRDRNARRRVEEQAQELARTVAALIRGDPEMQYFVPTAGQASVLSTPVPDRAGGGGATTTSTEN